MERSPVHRRMYLSLKDNAKIRHGESGNIRTVPHRSARFRKVPICSFHVDNIDFLGTDDTEGIYYLTIYDLRFIYDWVIW